MLALGGLMAHAALWRQESRGVHYRRDYPRIDERRFKTHLVLQANGVKWKQHPLEVR
jgi:succinate dehydrogenase/fumarate reductase flavoprotein subunit